jgi:hypothetical protein
MGSGPLPGTPFRSAPEGGVGGVPMRQGLSHPRTDAAFMNSPPSSFLLPCLADLRRRPPAWLADLGPMDLAAGPAPHLDRLLERAVVYPGAGLDLSPIRQCLGAVHSFLLLDYGTPEPEVRARLEEGSPAWRVLGELHPFDATTLLGPVPPAFRPPQDNPHRQSPPFGLWALGEGAGGERFSLLYAALEGVEAIASLFPDRAPTGIVVQEHGLGGNCWGSAGFGQMLERLAQDRWPEPARFLLAGENAWHLPWSGDLEPVGEDVAVESMHLNRRTVLRSRGRAHGRPAL